MSVLLFCLMATAHRMTGRTSHAQSPLHYMSLPQPQASASLDFYAVTLRSALAQKWVRPAGQQGRQTGDRQLLPEHDVWDPGAAGASPDAERAGLLATGEAHRCVSEEAVTTTQGHSRERLRKRRFCMPALFGTAKCEKSLLTSECTLDLLVQLLCQAHGLSARLFMMNLR